MQLILDLFAFNKILNFIFLFTSLIIFIETGKLILPDYSY